MASIMLLENFLNDSVGLTKVLVATWVEVLLGTS